jgi:CysZ protein
MGKALGELAEGFTFPFQAIPYVFRHRLFGLTGLCLAVHLILVAAVLVPLIYFTWPLMADLQNYLVTRVDGHAVLMTILSGLGWFLRILALLLVFLATGVLVLVIGRVAAGPFLDLLSERVEELETGVAAPAFSWPRLMRGVGLAIFDLFPNLAILVVFQLVVWFLGFIPIVGTIGAPVLSGAGASIFLAHEFMGLPLQRRFAPYFARWRFVFDRKARSIGFGAACFVLMLVPFLNLALLPLCAIGGTFAVCRGEREAR